jgi:hypothetical protein
MKDWVKKLTMFLFCMALGYGFAMAIVILYEISDMFFFKLGGLNAGLFLYWIQGIWDVEESRHIKVPGVDNE